MRRILPGILAAVAVVCASVSTFAQRPSQRVPFAPDRVTVLTDGLADPASPAVQMIAELASRLAPGGLRVLPMAGEGALGNLRDLLLLRGVDLAILDGDVLARAELSGEYPDAARKTRFVSHLYDQTIYVLARKPIGAFEGLRGRRIAAGSGGATARTLLGLLRTEAEVARLEPGWQTRADALAGIDGIVLLGNEVARLGDLTDALREFQLLPMPPSATLRRAYRPVTIATAELAGVSRPPAPLDGLAVSTLLAVFDWTPQQSRYANVTSFFKGMFAALPALRDSPSAALWRQADVKAAIPGWTRHAAAEPARLLTPAQLASLAAIERPAPSPPREVRPPAPNAAPASPPPLSLVALARAPLADERAADGGLVPSLIAEGLAAAARGRRPELRWSPADAATLHTLAAEQAADILLPVEQADCERPNDLTQAQALLCDRATFSEPVMQVVIGLFTLAGSDFKFEHDAAAHGRTLCVPADRDLSDLTGSGRNWIAAKRVTLLRQPTLLACAGLVQRREADAFVATDLEGWHVLKQVGIAPQFTLAERPLGTRTIHAAVWKSHARAGELIDAVNAAIRQGKANGQHAAQVRRHLMSIWNEKPSVR